MLTRFGPAIVIVVAALTLAGPMPASARMHFTATRERLEAVSQRATSALALTNPTEVQTQARELANLAQAAKAAAEEAAGRPASGAEDKTVLADVVQAMDGAAASANRAAGASGGDQRAALQEVKDRSDRSLSAVQARIQAQLAAAPAGAPGASPGPATLPSSGRDPGPAGPVVWAGGLGLLAVLVGAGLWAARRRVGA